MFRCAASANPMASLEVVHGVDLDIKSGEFVVFVGPSGCGKSTLLRMIAGLEPISGGEISIGGKVVNDVPSPQRGIAMVFQSYALYPHMSVYDNMAFGLKLAKTPKAEVDQRVREAARILQIEPYLDRMPKALSGGQRQRVAIGRAIVRKPKVFLFDEPLSNLDASLRAQTRIEIAKLHDTLDATMIYVTHDQVEAMTLADRIVVLNAGRDRAGRHAARTLSQPGQHLRRRLYRQPAHELHRRVTRVLADADHLPGNATASIEAIRSWPSATIGHPARTPDPGHRRIR